MASRELNIIIRAKNLAAGAIAGVKKELGSIGSEARRGFATAATNIARGAVVVGGAAAIGLATQIRAGIDSLGELQNVQAQTQAALQSTGAAAGVNAEQIRNLAEKYEGLNATIDDKVIQSGENLLLTFTNIRKDAFEPALQAALDMNQRLGGGEEGLQGVIQRLGRALNDPAKGLALLARSGVSLDKDTVKRILDLQKQNRLFDAQSLLLDELSKRYGGSFEAAGKTFEGRMAKVRDVVEDAQMALARAFLPLIEKVADKLATWLSDPAVMKGIEDFGSSIAGALDDAMTFLTEEVDWNAILGGLKAARDVAKTILDTFLSLPSWVQTAIVTGWGLNKLTGGALGNIVGSLASGLIKGVLGINAGVVNINAATVNGPGGIGRGAPVAGAPGAGGFLAPGLGAALAGVALPFIMFNLIPELFKGPPGSGAKPMTTRAGALSQTNVAMAQGRQPGFITAVEAAGGKPIPVINPTGQATWNATRSDLDKLRSETRELRDPLKALDRNQQRELQRNTARLEQIRGQAASAQASLTAQAARQASLTASQLGRLDTMNAKLPPVTNVTVHNTVNTNVSVSATSIAAKLTRTTLASSTTFRGGLSPF